METHLDSQEVASQRIEKGSGLEHWSLVNDWPSICWDESDWAQTITKPEKLLFRATTTNWEVFSFLFHKHTTPATRRVGARVLLSDFSNVCNIPYNHTEMKPIELSSLLQTKFSSGQPRQTEKPFELSLSHVLLRGTSWYAGVAARNLRGVCERRGVPATHVLLSRVSKWLQYNPTRRDEAPRTSFGLYKCFYIPGIYHNFGIMFWKNTLSYLENLCILRGKF